MNIRILRELREARPLRLPLTLVAALLLCGCSPRVERAETRDDSGPALSTTPAPQAAAPQPEPAPVPLQGQASPPAEAQPIQRPGRASLGSALDEPAKRVRR